MNTLNARLEQLETDTALAPQGDQGCESTLATSSEEENLVARINELQKRTLAILRKAEATGRADMVLKSLREARSNMELLARLTGEFDRSPEDSRITAVIIMPTQQFEDDEATV